jgi:hypothetical protein
MVYGLSFRDERTDDSVKTPRFRFINYDAAMRFRKGFLMPVLRGGCDIEDFLQRAFLPCLASVANIGRALPQNARLFLVLVTGLNAQSA